MGFFSDVADGVGDVFSDVVDAVEDVVDDIIDMTVGEILEEIWDAIETLGEALEEAGKAVVGFVEAGGELFYLLGNTLGEGLDYVMNAVVSAGTVIFGEVYDFAGELKGFVVDGFLFLVDVTAGAFALFAQGLKLAAEFALDAITFNPSILENLWTNVEDFAKSILRVYEVTIRGIFGLAGNLIEMTLGRLAEYLVKLLKPIPFLGEYLSIAVQFLYDTLTLAVWVAEFFFSIPFLLTCLLSDLLFEDPDFDKLLPMLSTYPAAPIRRGAIQVLPPPSKNGGHEIKYAILSDMHLFFEGLTDFHTITGSDEIQLHLLNKLADDGYHLIENGDVEDLWRRDSGHDDQVGGRGHATREGNKMQFKKIVQNNAELYNLIYEKFQSRNRYTRTVGNHDLEMTDNYMQKELRKVYPGTRVAEFVLIGDGTKIPEFIIGHGHQVDLFNRKGCEWFGSIMTRLASMWEEVTDEFYKASVVEDENVASIIDGRNNILSNHPDPVLGATQLGEIDLYKDYARMNSKMDLPGIIFGHSHDPKMFPGFAIARWQEGFEVEQISVWKPSEADSPYKSQGYLNSGTCGMWEGFVWFITLESTAAGEITSSLKGACIRKEPNNIKYLKIYTFESYPPGSTDPDTGDIINPGLVQNIFPVGNAELIPT